jgi:hypothetical protein
MTLEDRVRKLETKTATLPLTMLALIVAMVAVVFMQHRINLSLKKQLNSANRISYEDRHEK